MIDFKRKPKSKIDLLKKKVINLKKKAKTAIENKGLDNQKAQVVLVLDISKSMNRLFKDGTIQEVIERILALALNFDDDNKIDIILFGTRAYKLPSISIDEIANYVEREILAEYRIIEATKYAKALELIYNEYKNNTDEPVFVIFITDGNNSDKRETTELIRELSKEKVFFQFIGIGKESFPYLEKLDDLSDRYIDNAGFMKIDDISSIGDNELYSLLLNEFPDWIEEAKEKFN